VFAGKLLGQRDIDLIGCLALELAKTLDTRKQLLDQLAVRLCLDHYDTFSLLCDMARDPVDAIALYVPDEIL